MGGISVRKWDVYLANVPFEDLPVSKPRPVIILNDMTIVVLCIKMTGQPPRSGEYVLREWKKAGLRKQTTVRVSKVLKLKPGAFIKRLGALQPIDILEIQKLLT